MNSALAARYSGRLRLGGVASNASDPQGGKRCPKCAVATVEAQSEVGVSINGPQNG